jgi:hypothetical protein
MKKKFPILPAKPERICWGCDKFCPADSLACANERSPHPVELFGEDWFEWGNDQMAEKVEPAEPEKTPNP